MTALTLLPMQPEHIAEVAALERLCFGPNWSVTNFEKELDNPRCHYFVLVKAGRTLAYIGYWQILEEAHITSVGVHPDLRQQRLAQRLLCRMLDHCLDNGIKWITLEVKASNLAAQKLYEKFGFAIMGRRANYYQADKEDALIMWTENIEAPDYQERMARMREEINMLDMQERSAS